MILAAKVLALAGAAWLSLIASEAAASGRAQAHEKIRDWSVFVDGEARPTCWVATAPLTTTATKDGRPADVTRGEALLMVTFDAAKQVRNQVSVVAGYVFAHGAPVRLTIGEAQFDLFSHDRYPGGAWTEAVADDDAVVSAMLDAPTARLTGLSEAGVVVEDTFSTRGFSSALSEARGLCNLGLT